MKRVNDEDDIRFKKVRVCEDFDEGSEAVNEVCSGKLGVEGENYQGLSEKESSCTELLDSGNGKLVLEFDLNLDNVEKDSHRLDLDLNMPASGTEECTNEVISEKRVEVIDITSGESNAEEVVEVDVYGSGSFKGKPIEKGKFFENFGSLNLGLGTVEVDGDAFGNGSGNGEKRYSIADKGKAKVDDSWLSLTTDPSFFKLEADILGVEIIESRRSIEPLKIAESEFRIENSRDTFLAERRRRKEARKRERRRRELRYKEALVTYRQVARENASKLARLESKQENHCEETLYPEEKEGDKQQESVNSPFAIALKKVRLLNQMHRNKQFIDWVPSGDNAWKTSQRIVPSLLELSLKVLADNAMAIVSLECVPDALRHRLVDLLCSPRRMNIHIVDLLLKGAPTEIRIRDCHWLTEVQFSKTFRDLDMKSLRVLQLDLCGQCNFDDVFSETAGVSSNSLPNLGIISLKGACRLSDDAVKAIVTSAPALRSINLSQCSLLTETGINIIADSLGTILKELYIDECQRIDAMLILPALLKFKHLEVLSVAGIQTVCDQFVRDIVTHCGRSLKELNFADCLKLTNYSLKFIGTTCVDLRALNISKLEKLTDVAIEYLANGCRSIQTLKLHRNRFSDEAIAAFLEASGQSLKDLSLNNVSKVGRHTALSLAKCSRNLLNLDLSFCRKITNEALGLIVDSCLSLRLVKLFGCTQITEVFLNGHSNSLVQVVGLSNSPILDHMNILEPEEVLLRYSPLPLPSDS